MGILIPFGLLNRILQSVDGSVFTITYPEFEQFFRVRLRLAFGGLLKPLAVSAVPDVPESRSLDFQNLSHDYLPCFFFLPF